jgi:hypothetical protein
VTVPNAPLTLTDRFAFSACGKVTGCVITVGAGGESDRRVESKEVPAGVVLLYGTGAGGGGTCNHIHLVIGVPAGLYPGIHTPQPLPKELPSGERHSKQEPSVATRPSGELLINFPFLFAYFPQEGFVTRRPFGRTTCFVPPAGRTLFGETFGRSEPCTGIEPKGV